MCFIAGVLRLLPGSGRLGAVRRWGLEDPTKSSPSEPSEAEEQTQNQRETTGDKRRETSDARAERDIKHGGDDPGACVTHANASLAAARTKSGSARARHGHYWANPAR